MYTNFLVCVLIYNQIFKLKVVNELIKKASLDAVYVFNISQLDSKSHTKAITNIAWHQVWYQGTAKRK